MAKIILTDILELQHKVDLGERAKGSNPPAWPYFHGGRILKIKLPSVVGAQGLEHWTR